MSLRHLKGNVNKAIGYTSLEFREVQIEGVHMDIIGI